MRSASPRADPLPSLPIVAQAVWSERWLKLRYRNNGQVYARKLGPLGLVLKSGVWYLIAQSGKSLRTYRVAQMLDAAVTDEPFARPKKFDLAAHWEQSARAYETGVYREEAEVRLSPRGLSQIGALGPYVAAAAAASAARPDRAGHVRCRLPLESLDVGMRELMRLGNEVEVLGPPELRLRFAEMLNAMARRHQA